MANFDDPDKRERVIRVRLETLRLTGAERERYTWSELLELAHAAETLMYRLRHELGRREGEVARTGVYPEALQ